MLASLLIMSAGCSFNVIAAMAPGDGGAPKDATSDQSSPGDAGARDAMAASDAKANDGEVPSNSELHVEPLYPAGKNINDYVDAKDPSKPCDPNSVPYSACLNGGLYRKVTLPTLHSCANVYARDGLEWFDWKCKIEGGSAVFYTASSGGSLYAGLSSFIAEGSKPRWRANSVVIQDLEAGELGRTVVAPFWDNPVLEVPDARNESGVLELDVAGAVYVFRSAAPVSFDIVADRIALLLRGADGEDILPPSADTKPLVRAIGRKFVWISAFSMFSHRDVSNRSIGVEVDLVFGVLEGFALQSSSGTPNTRLLDIRARSSIINYLWSDAASAQGAKLAVEHSKVADTHFWGAGASCVELAAVSSDIDGISVGRCGGAGIALRATSGSSFSGLRSVATTQAAIDARFVTDSTFDQVDVGRSGADGILVTALTPSEQSANNVFTNVSTNNNAGHGFLLEGRNHRALTVMATSNGADGLRASGDANLVMHVTAADNKGSGVVADGSSGLFANIVTTNNAAGLRIAATADSTRVMDLAAAHNDIDLAVEGERSVFEGDVLLTEAESCSVTSQSGLPGFVQAPCASVAPSTAVVKAPSTFATAFVGTTLIDNSFGPPVDRDGNLPCSDVVYWLPSEADGSWRKSGAFPSASIRGPGTDGETCAGWRYYPYSPPLKGAFEAAGLPILQHQWAAASKAECNLLRDAVWSAADNTCGSRFIAYAYEDLAYTYGPACGPGLSARCDGLCQAGDSCLFTLDRGVNLLTRPLDRHAVQTDLGKVYSYQ